MLKAVCIVAVYCMLYVAYIYITVTDVCGIPCVVSCMLNVQHNGYYGILFMWYAMFSMLCAVSCTAKEKLVFLRDSMQCAVQYCSMRRMYFSGIPSMYVRGHLDSLIGKSKSSLHKFNPKSARENCIPRAFN